MVVVVIITAATSTSTTSGATPVTTDAGLLLLVCLTVVVTDSCRNGCGLLVRVTSAARLITVIIVTVTVLLLWTVTRALQILLTTMARTGLLLYPAGALDGHGRSGLGLVRRRRRRGRRSFGRHVPAALSGWRILC